ncbi:uncharacterized protein ARMOST_18553 [Armillaria ostoyae]|uniref:Uncharacterized protein n=1 Tax=Armillaria ostoyae TaxID=47428 RepID=A0A284S219_ARMOS|nr:uncharacterized protein ARMOST_18553 [Armillaria ostoyae]
MVRYAANLLSRSLAPSFAPLRGTLEDLEKLAIKLNLLHKGIRVRWTPTASPVRVEYATLTSLAHIPPIVVSISSIVASLSGSIKNSRVIDAVVAETLANHPTIPPQWPSNLDSFWDSLNDTDLYNHNLVLVAPGSVNLERKDR